MPERAFTQWSPDTCDCIIQYYNDDASHAATVQACSKHATNAGTPQHLTDVLAHNRKKNAVMKDLDDNSASLQIPLVSVDGGPTSRKALPFKARYDRNAPVGNDPVIIEVPASLGIEQQKLNTWQNYLNTHYGVGAVTIVVV